MPYLIDGHNLIAQLPDIDITDPHDEGKLVVKLRGFAAKNKKKITVVFDNGIPAGISTGLSNASITVRFAPPNSSADALLKQIIRQIKDPKNWTLVSSDLDVIETAQLVGMQSVTAQVFAEQINQLGKKKSHSQKKNPNLSQAEVEEWLELFGEEDAGEESDDDVWNNYWA